MLGLPLLLALLASPQQDPSPLERIPLHAPPSEVPFSMQRWGVAEGLPQAIVNDIAIDADGRLWVGTHGGLAQFDGAEFIEQQQIDGRWLASMRILSLAFDADGALWIGTEENGLAVLHHGQGRWIEAEGLEDELLFAIEGIERGPDGSMWVSSAGGVSRFDREGSLQQFIALDDCQDVAFPADGSLLISGPGVWRYRDGELEQLYEEASVQCIHVTADGTIWAGDHHSRILRFDTHDAWMRWVPADDHGGMRDIHEDADGTIWFAGWNPVRYRDGEFATIVERLPERSPAPLHNPVLTRDAEGTIWIGGSGLSALRELPLWASVATSFNTDTPRIVHEDPARPGVLWVGHYSGALSRVGTDGVAEPVELADGSRLIGESLALGADGMLHAASGRDGLVRLGRHEPETRIAPEATLGGEARALLADEDGGWWISSDAALQHFDRDGTRRVWAAEQGLDLGTIYKLCFDRRGTLWIGARFGAAALDPQAGTLRTWGEVDGIAPAPVREIHFLASGAALLGHYGAGLSLLRDGETPRTIGLADGLHENVVHRIIELEDGALLLLGNRGLSMLAAEEVRALDAGRNSLSLTPRVFDTAARTPVFEGMGGAMPAGVMTSSGDLVFPALQSVVHFRPSIAGARLPAPHVQIQEIVVSTERLDPALPHSLQAEARNMAVRFRASCFVDRHLLRYQYQLVGADPDWRDAGNNELVHYSNLAPGEYRFRVRATNRDGVWSEVVESAPMVLQPHWFERRVVWLGGGVLLIAAASWFITMRFRMQRRRREALERVVAERTADLAAARDQAEKLTAERTKDLRQALEKLRADMEERDELRKQLSRTERLDALGRLAGGIAHDFNNILTAVLGEADLGHASTDDEDARRRFERIRAAGERATELTSQMLAFGRTQPMRRELVRLDDAVRSATELLQPLLPKAIQLEWRLEADEACLSIDPTQLSLVVMNLVLNARDAIDGAGRIVVHTRCDAEQVELRVEDDGAGIPAEVQPHVFDPFFTTKGPGEGTGLGLSSVHGAVTRAGGRVDFHSAPGRGAQFQVTFPRVAAPSQAEQSVGSGPSDAVHARRRPTVLLCDDEPSVLQIMERSLDGESLQVLTADSPELALQIMREHAGLIDLVVTDSVMPAMSGEQLAAAIRAARPGTSICFVSGYSHSGLSAAGSLDEQAPFLSKPFRPEAFRRFVLEQLSSSPEPASPRLP